MNILINICSIACLSLSFTEARIEDFYWDALKVTFGLDPMIDFSMLPRHHFGKGTNFTKIDQNETCMSGGGLFRGYRYWMERDPSVILLFDKNGYIAGMQTAVPEIHWHDLSKVMLNTYVLNDTGLFTLTVYFVDPSIICTTGRNATEFWRHGTGTGLYIQNGPNITKDFEKIPDKEDDVKDSLWGHGKCYYQMGQHYWHDIHKTMSCTDFVPYCLLYNRGKLNAFCFALNANLDSDRYEHPPEMLYEDFFEPVPDCFKTEPSYLNATTMHVYLTSDVLEDKC